MMELKIEYISKEQLKPYCNNAKIHTAEQIEQIKQSIREFSFNDPIAIWHEDEIIEGHGRLLAVMEMPEIEKVPVIRLDGLTDEQRRAYMLVHNKLTMNTDFDIDILGIEMDDIVDIDMSEFGFDLDFGANQQDDQDAEIKTVELKPYHKVHYLISLDVNDNDKVVELISQFRQMEGIEVESTLN